MTLNHGKIHTGVGAVVVVTVMPAHQLALEYRTVPEQAESYIGTSLGTWVILRATISVREAGERAVTAGGKS